MQFFTALTRPFAAFLSDDPSVAMMQAGLLTLVVVVLFMLFFTLRDIVLRTRSFVYQCFCILLVALLPGLGFLLYLLIRPARTIKERETEAMLQALLEGFFGDDMMPEDGDEVPDLEETPAEEAPSVSDDAEESEEEEKKPASSAHRHHS
jgi:hypothetical protein